MAKYGRPIAEELEMESEQLKSSGISFWRRWLVGFEILVSALVLFQFADWAVDAISALKGASAVLYYGCALAAICFVWICSPLLAYEMACWVVLRPWNKERILQSLQSDQRASDENETQPEQPSLPRQRAGTRNAGSAPDASSA